MLRDAAGAAARRLADVETLVEPIAGGIAVCLEPGSPFNKIAGLGFDGVPPEDVLDRIERTFTRRGIPAQVELASLGDPAIGPLLTARGYRLAGFENVLGLSLHAGAIEAIEEKRPNASVEVTAAGPDESAIWTDAILDGFLHADTFDGPPSHESFDRELLARVLEDTIAARSFERYLARRGGAPAGGASLRLQDGIAQLSGAATLPAHRRQGVQTALLLFRLVEALRRGCDIAVVTTQPGSKSQQNVQGFGFSLLYVRAILVRALA